MLTKKMKDLFKITFERHIHGIFGRHLKYLEDFIDIEDSKYVFGRFLIYSEDYWKFIHRMNFFLQKSLCVLH